ncbi:hypothetical protein DFH28DRAFT_1127537 [Melampsora americana]|nr:hypothetical protein DFH28DRAFT_1127537 [Melampsora americana]
MCNFRNTPSSKTLEFTLESQINDYSKLSTSISTDYNSNGTLNHSNLIQSKETEDQIEDNLKQLSLLVDQLFRLIETNPSTSILITSNAHKEILNTFQSDFKRTQASLKQSEQRASLLSSVRSEISSFKSQHSSDPDHHHHLNDRDRIHSSHRLADDILDQAYATRQEFSIQRNSIQSTSHRINRVISSIPGVNSIVGMIQSRRRRDTLILGLIAGSLTFLLLIYTFR